MENFVDQPLSHVWERIYDLYETVLNLKANRMKPDKGKQLKTLDNWYQEDLPGVIKGRKDRYVTQQELCKLMKWKLTRGKFRPRLEQLVQSNSEEEVKSASLKAFKELPNTSNAVKALTVLKAIGPATASAVLAAGAPDHVPFMADESMLALPGLSPLQYTLPAFNQYADEVKKVTRKLNQNKTEPKWTPHKVELTLWTYYMAKSLCPEKLSEVLEMPSATKRKSMSDNGAENKKLKTKKE